MGNSDYIENKYGMVTDVCMYGDQCMAMYDIIPYMVNQKIKKKKYDMYVIHFDHHTYFSSKTD